MTNKTLILLIVSTIIIAGSAYYLTRCTPIICVTPEKALLDEPVTISISHLAPNEQVTLEAACKDKENNVWKSSATFKADDNGTVNVATQSPISGSYSGIDPMGLFWSMVPTAADVAQRTYISKYTLNLLEVSLSVFVNNKLRAQKTLYRIPVAPNIEKRDIRTAGIVGTFWYSNNMQKGPAVIVAHGSGGRIPDNYCQLLASHGYAVLGLAYFGAEGLPESYSQVPLEYCYHALQWLKKQPQVDGSRIALCGHSKGGEFVLLTASTFPDQVAAVVIYGSPCFAYGDFAPEEKAAWTYKNKPVPFMPNLSEQEIMTAVKEGHMPFHQGTIEDPLQEVTAFIYAMKKFSAKIQESTIPVEKIRCPILIISGEDDAMLPATLQGNLIMERLNQKGSSIARKHLHYPQAGHALLTLPYAPSIDLPVPFGPVWGLFGGTPEGNAHAHKQAWQEVLEFLKETLK